VAAFLDEAVDVLAGSAAWAMATNPKAKQTVTQTLAICFKTHSTNLEGQSLTKKNNFARSKTWKRFIK
jgi:hypothetical protein